MRSFLFTLRARARAALGPIAQSLGASLRTGRGARPKTRSGPQRPTSWGQSAPGATPPPSRVSLSPQVSSSRLGPAVESGFRVALHVGESESQVESRLRRSRTDWQVVGVVELDARAERQWSRWSKVPPSRKKQERAGSQQPGR